MSVISILEAVPNRVRALVRLVGHAGPLGREALQAHMIPVGDGGQFGNVVRETMRLGLLEDHDGALRLPAGINRRDVQDDGWFIAFVHRRLFEEPLPANDDNRPVAYAVAWLLTRRPGLALKWNGEHKSAMLADLTGDDTYDVTNSSRAAMLAYWARFTGYAESVGWSGSQVVVPDPTKAIARCLPHVFATEKELLIDAFVERLAQLCPVLEGGTIRQEVESRLRRQRPPSTLSPTTSLALLRLRRRGVLGWEEKSDAKRIMLLDFMHDETERVSHIRKHG